MRRILLVLTLALVIAAMLAGSALPAQAAVPGDKPGCKAHVKELQEFVKEGTLLLPKDTIKATRESCNDLPKEGEL